MSDVICEIEERISRQQNKAVARPLTAKDGFHPGYVGRTTQPCRIVSSIGLVWVVDEQKVSVTGRCTDNARDDRYMSIVP